MTSRKLVRIVFQSIRRNKRDFVFSSVGIIIGISTLLFFTALGAGIKVTVLERVFMVRQIEVIPKSYEVGAFQSKGLLGTKRLDDERVEKFAAFPGVTEVYPKMKLTFPTGAYGGEELLGQNIRGELVADGIPESMITEEDISGELTFRDWDDVSCQGDEGCPGGYTCGEEGVCQGVACDPPKRGSGPGADDPACDGILRTVTATGASA